MSVYIPREELNIKKFIKNNTSAVFPEYLNPAHSTYEWSNYPYLFRPINLSETKYLNLKPAKLFCLFNDTGTLSIVFKDFKILINSSNKFYNFDEIKHEYQIQIVNICNKYIKRRDEKKGLLIENGWIDLGDFGKIYPNGDDSFVLKRHEEFNIYHIRMKIEYYDKSFYIDMPDNDFCKQKFIEWFNEHSEKGIVDRTLKSLEHKD